MARTAFVRNFVVSDSWTVPAGKYFVGTVLGSGNNGDMSINGSAGLTSHVNNGTAKPLVLPSGTTVTTSANFLRATMTGFLYDN